MRQTSSSRHYHMLEELEVQRSERVTSIHALTREFNSNEEHPVEQHVRRYDTGPMPESYATYRTRHDRRIQADAHNEGWAGTCRVRDIAMARDAMRSILQHRSQRARLDNRSFRKLQSSGNGAPRPGLSMGLRFRSLCTKASATRAANARGTPICAASC